MVDNRKRIAVNVVFILFSLTAVLSMALDVFMVLRLELKTSQEMLIAQATLRWNEFICRTKQKGSLQRKARAYWKKKNRRVSFTLCLRCPKTHEEKDCPARHCFYNFYSAIDRGITSLVVISSVGHY